MVQNINIVNLNGNKSFMTENIQVDVLKINNYFKHF